VGYFSEMSGEGEGKKELKGAKVFIHEKGKSLARVTHIDVEHPELNKIIKPKEATYAQGKEGGFFLGLKKNMIKRAEQLLKKPES
jgi:hypothetical protein